MECPMLDDGINHDYDGAQDSHCWEEHKGLAHLAARRMCERDSRLSQHFDDIVHDLTTKIWEILQRPGDNAGYDKSKGRISTYIMTALFRYYRIIKRQYLSDIGPTSLHYSIPVHHIEDQNRLSYVISASNTDDLGRDADIAESCERLLAEMTSKQRRAMVLHAQTGESFTNIAKVIGVSGSACRLNKKKAINAISRLEMENPKLIEEIKDLIGVAT